MAKTNAENAMESREGPDPDAVQPLLDDLQRGMEALHSLRSRIAAHEARANQRRRAGR